MGEIEKKGPVALNATTLAVLLVAGWVGRDSLDAQAGATQQIATTTEVIRDDVRKVREDMGALRARLEVVEAMAPRLAELERRVVRAELELERVRECARTRGKDCE